MWGGGTDVKYPKTDNSLCVWCVRDSNWHNLIVKEQGQGFAACLFLLQLLHVVVHPIQTKTETAAMKL